MRSQAREAAFKIIFASLFNDDIDEEFRASVYRQAKLSEKDYMFAENLYRTVRAHREELIATITGKVERFAEDRIYPADKAVLMLALAEIKYFDDVPPVVSVDEAVAIARKYSAEKSAEFVNGVLGGVINS